MTFTGKTVEEATETGLKELGIAEADAEIIVIDEGSKSLFAKRDAMVDIVRKDGAPIEKKNQTEEESTVGMAEVNEEEFLEKLLSMLEINAEIKVSEEEDKKILTLVSEDSSSIIGYRGEMLDAIQTLVCACANIGKKEYRKVAVDCENYRGKREDTLIKLAHKLEEKATEMRREVQLEPMNPYERRIIHTALSESQTVTTKSEGKEPNRFVVIVPNDKDEYSTPYNAGANHGDRAHGGSFHDRRGNGDRRNGNSRRGGESGFIDKPRRHTPSGFGAYLGNSLKDKE